MSPLSLDQEEPTLDYWFTCVYNVVTMTVKTKITKFGNSKGVRLPKILLIQSQLTDDVELAAEPGKIIISVRKNAGSDELKDFRNLTNGFDENEWTW